jgi:hypothetical protein
VLLRLNRLVGRHLPHFGQSAGAPSALSPGLAQAIDSAQVGVRQRFSATTQRAMQVTTPAMLEDLHQRKQALKKAAATPEERATIEIVALLFQSILTEDRIPASGARVVRPAADAGAARGRVRARLLRHHRPPGAPPDRPHGRLRDGLRQRGPGRARRWKRRSSASCRSSRPTPTPAGGSSRPC